MSGIFKGGLCAVDLAGDEADFPLENIYSLFEYAKKLDYPFTIHAGECGDENNVLLASEWGIKRIGHGIAVMGPPEVIEVVAQKGMGVEMCKISNYQTKALPPETVYPICEFAKADVFITINTDNSLISNTSIAEEMKFLNERFGKC